MESNGKRSTKNRILEAARETFVESGYDRSNMADIAVRAGVSRKTLYSYFTDKPGLFKEMFLSTIHGQEAMIDEVFEDDSRSYLERFSTVISLVSEQLAWLRGPLIEDIRRTFPDIWSDTQDFRDGRVLANFSRILDEGVEEGFFRDDINERLLLMTWFAASQYVLTPEALSELPLTGDEAFRALLSIILEGTLTTAGREKYTGKILANKTVGV